MLDSVGPVHPSPLPDGIGHCCPRIVARACPHYLILRAPTSFVHEFGLASSSGLLPGLVIGQEGQDDSLFITQITHANVSHLIRSQSCEGCTRLDGLLGCSADLLSGCSCCMVFQLLSITKDVRTRCNSISTSTPVSKFWARSWKNLDCRSSGHWDPDRNVIMSNHMYVS